MRLLGPALLLALVALAAPLADAQAAPRLDVSLKGLPESLGTMQSGQARNATFHVDVRLDGVACTADAKLPVTLAFDDHTQASFLRVAIEPDHLTLLVPQGAYPGSTAGNDASYHGVGDASIRVLTGGVTADTSFLIEVTASAAGLPEGCKATGDVPPATSAPMATRVVTQTPPRPEALASPSAPATTSPQRNSPGPSLELLVIGVVALGSLMRRVKP